MLSPGERWQLKRASNQGGGGGCEGNRRWGLLGRKERCEAKVRQMVADNEDVETRGGGGCRRYSSQARCRSTQHTGGGLRGRSAQARVSPLAQRNL